VKLFEHPDFEQVVLRATEHFHSQGLRPAIVEKDYYVTEALRIIAAEAHVKGMEPHSAILGRYRRFPRPARVSA
jgi:hypothetical protein